MKRFLRWLMAPSEVPFMDRLIEWKMGGPDRHWVMASRDGGTYCTEEVRIVMLSGKHRRSESVRIADMNRIGTNTAMLMAIEKLSHRLEHDHARKEQDRGEEAQ